MTAPAPHVRVAARPAAPDSSRRRQRLSAAGLVAAAAMLLTGCATVPRGAAEASWLEYLEVARRLQAQGAALEPGGEAERRAIERFQGLLSDYKAPGFGPGIRRVYADDVFFNDTLETLHGVEAVERHLVATAEAIEAGTVEFVDLVAENGNYYFRWVMTIRFKRFARGEDKVSVGMTHVRFDADGRVLLHQDFWDSAGGLFEHTPALGWLLRWAKKRA